MLRSPSAGPCMAHIPYSPLRLPKGEAFLCYFVGKGLSLLYFLTAPSFCFMVKILHIWRGNMKNTLRTAFIGFLCLCFLCSAAYAHSGRTDGNGGHWNRKTGEYHYHCGGYPAHQHPGGVCPYRSGGIVTTKAPSTTKKTSTTKAPATTVKPVTTTAKITTQAPTTAVHTDAPQSTTTKTITTTFAATTASTKRDTANTSLTEPPAIITSETSATSGDPLVAAHLGVDSMAPAATTAQHSDSDSPSFAGVIIGLILAALILYLIISRSKRTNKK